MRRRGRTPLQTAIVMLAVLASAPACAPASGVGQPVDAVATPGARPGAGAHAGEDLGVADYDWTIRTLAGERIELAAFRGRVLFINVWASWCPPCVAEMESIERLRDSLAESGVVFLLVSPEGPAPVRRFLAGYGYDLPIHLEVDPMPDAFGLEALPTTYVVDRAGRIALRHRGATDWDRDDVREFLRSLGG